MARTCTIAEIKTRCRERADMVSTQFITDAELLSMINEAYGEFYDVLVGAFQNYFASTATLTLVPGTATYAQPADFYKLISVELVNGGTTSLLYPFNERDRNSTIATAAAIPSATATVRYIPAPTKFTTDAQTIDGVAGWETLLITDVAIMMLDKEESNTDRLERRRVRELGRIQSMAQNRDVTSPGIVTDVTAYSSGSVRDTLQYRFFGSSIEFMSVTYY